MNVTVHIPDDLVDRLGAGSDLSRRALEALAFDAFGAGRLSRPELARLLGFETDAALDNFLNLRSQTGRSERDEFKRQKARKAAADIIEGSKGVTLGGISIKELINEGRP